MNNIDWSKYDDEALNFVYNESSKMLEETVKSFREAGNKGFIALAAYSGIISYCFNQIIKLGNLKLSIPYLIMALGILIAVFLLWKNLLPRRMILPGALPHTLVNNYFEQDDFNGAQKRQMIITKIINHDEAIKKNIEQAVARSKGTKHSAFIFLVFLFFSLTSAFFC